MSVFTSGIGGYIADYLELKVESGHNRRSYEYELAAFDRLCADRFSGEAALTKEMADAWSARNGQEGAGSQARRIGIVRGFGRYMQSMGADAYVIPDKVSPKSPRPAPYLFTEAELAGLFAAVDGMEWPNDPALELTLPVLLRLTYTCGLRPSEGRTAKLGDVCLSTGEVMLRDTKNHGERTVVISGSMAECLSRYLDTRRLWFDGSPWLFPASDDKPIGAGRLSSCFKRCWETACSASGAETPRARVYDLRHRFASACLIRWIDEGRDVNAMLPVLQSYLGHKCLASTAYYVHILPESVSRSAGIDWQAMQDIIPEAAPWEG